MIQNKALWTSRTEKRVHQEASFVHNSESNLSNISWNVDESKSTQVENKFKNDENQKLTLEQTPWQIIPNTWLNSTHNLSLKEYKEAILQNKPNCENAHKWISNNTDIYQSNFSKNLDIKSLIGKRSNATTEKNDLSESRVLNVKDDHEECEKICPQSKNLSILDSKQIDSDIIHNDPSLIMFGSANNTHENMYNNLNTVKNNDSKKFSFKNKEVCTWKINSLKTNHPIQKTSRFKNQLRYDTNLSQVKSQNVKIGLKKQWHGIRNEAKLTPKLTNINETLFWRDLNRVQTVKNSNKQCCCGVSKRLPTFMPNCQSRNGQTTCYTRYRPHNL